MGCTLVIILSVTAASVGLTLTRSCNAIFAELYWVPATILQAEARVHRKGQNHQVDIHYCMHPAAQSLDSIVFAVINKKHAGGKELLDGFFQSRLDLQGTSKFMVREPEAEPTTEQLQQTPKEPEIPMTPKRKRRQQPEMENDAATPPKLTHPKRTRRSVDQLDEAVKAG